MASITNIYFRPGLTILQRAEAFKLYEERYYRLSEERRYRINELHESNLKMISRGQIVKVPEKIESSDAGGQSVAVVHNA